MYKLWLKFLVLVGAYRRLMVLRMRDKWTDDYLCDHCNLHRLVPRFNATIPTIFVCLNCKRVGG